MYNQFCEEMNGGQIESTGKITSADPVTSLSSYQIHVSLHIFSPEAGIYL